MKISHNLNKHKEHILYVWHSVMSLMQLYLFIFVIQYGLLWQDRYIARLKESLTGLATKQPTSHTERQRWTELRVIAQ